MGNSIFVWAMVETRGHINFDAPPQKHPPISLECLTRKSGAEHHLISLAATTWAVISVITKPNEGLRDSRRCRKALHYLSFL